MQLGGYADNRFVPMVFSLLLFVAHFRQLPVSHFNYFQARQSLRIVQFYITFRPMENLYEGENETYIEASAENSGSILYDKEIRDKPRTRRTKRNV